VSISGGVDSAVTLGLMKRAMGMPGSPIKKILGICQPIRSSVWAADRAQETAHLRWQSRSPGPWSGLVGFLVWGSFPRLVRIMVFCNVLQVQGGFDPSNFSFGYYRCSVYSLIS